MSNKLVFLGVGGTIAGQAVSTNDNVGYVAAKLRVDDLLRSVPSLNTLLNGIPFVSEQVAQIDSKDMTHATWFVLAERVLHHLSDPESGGIVITHGTDTLEETAYFLSMILPAESQNSKPVVLTCAMRPATASSPDGPQNLAEAVAVALADGAKGVLVACAGSVHGGRSVQKVHPYRLDAFDAGEGGPLGVVEEGCVRMFQPWPLAHAAQTVALSDLPHANAWPRVEIVMSHAGVGGGVVRALRAQVNDIQGPLRGLVVAGTGNGSIHRDMVQALQDAQSNGIRVVRTTRCAYGSIVRPGEPAREEFTSMDVSPVKARIALMLTLAAESNRQVPQKRAL